MNLILGVVFLAIARVAYKGVHPPNYVAVGGCIAMALYFFVTTRLATWIAACRHR